MKAEKEGKDKRLEEEPPSPTGSASESQQDSKRSLVLSMTVIQYFSNSVFCQLSPFYPIKARERGVSQLYIGFVFGVMALA